MVCATFISIICRSRGLSRSRSDTLHSSIKFDRYIFILINSPLIMRRYSHVFTKWLFKQARPNFPSQRSNLLRERERERSFLLHRFFTTKSSSKKSMNLFLLIAFQSSSVALSDGMSLKWIEIVITANNAENLFVRFSSLSFLTLQAVA